MAALRLVVSCAVLVTACSGGCEGGTRVRKGAATDRPEPELATLEGVVRLAEGAELPAFAPEAMYQSPLKHQKRADRPQQCAPPKKSDRRPFELADDRGLGGIMVAASGFDGIEPREPKTHDVVIRDCRLHPRLVVAQRGDRLRITSEMNYPFMPQFGVEQEMKTLIKGQSRLIELDMGPPRAIRCGFTAACGRTDVVVLSHPVYATTGEGGRFRIERFPAGQEVTVSAWHPLFREAKQTLQVSEGETGQVSLTLSPRPARGEQPAADAGDAGAQPSGTSSADEPEPILE